MTLGYRNYLKRLHFSMIIFNVQEVQASGDYALEYFRIDITRDGGFIPLRPEFENNSIIGLTNFSTYRTATVIVFTMNFEDRGDDSGFVMPKSVTPNPSWQIVSDYGFSFFYIKTWKCS